MRLLISALLFQAVLPAQIIVGGDYAADFEAWLTREAVRHWDERERAIARLESVAQIHARQDYVRKTVVDLIGGLPKAKSPLNPRVTGQFQRNDYRVENVIF